MRAGPAQLALPVAGCRSTALGAVCTMCTIVPQAAKIKSLGDDVLVLFSGDAYHPSLLSTITQV